jgi:PAS domain S-box-containing protein
MSRSGEGVAPAERPRQCPRKPQRFGGTRRFQLARPCAGTVQCGVGLASFARRASLRPGLKYDLIQQTAYFMLVLRVLEGVAAWVLFNQVFLPVVTDTWPVPVLIAVYFVVNSILCLRYRSGRISSTVVVADAAVNLCTMTLVAGWTGGVASPVVLVTLFKIAGYAFVFSPQTGVMAISITLSSFAVLIAGDQLAWWNTIPIDALPVAVERYIDFAFRVSVAGTILLGATWLFKQVADKEGQVAAQARRAHAAAERERAAATVTGALLAVSEAVSRVTRIDDILNKVVDVAPRVLSVDYCGIFLWSEETATYRGAAVSGVEPALARQLIGMRLTPAEVPDLEWVRHLGHCAVMAPRGIARLGAPEAPTLLTAPLLSGGRFYGVVQFARLRGKSGFTQRDLTIADGVASQTAVALERARLVEESRRLVRAVESTQEAVLITDRDRRIVFTNHAFRTLFGYGEHELLGHDALTVGSEMSDDWVRQVQERVVEGNWSGEATARRRDGSTFPMALHVSLIRGDDGIEGSLAIIEDISAQKELQERMHRADRLAAAGELAAGVAHEVNNALSGILGQVEAARDATDLDSLRTAMAHVETQGYRIADIVQGLLGFARPQPPQRGPVNVRALVNDTLTLMAHDLGRSRIRSEAHFAPDLPPVLADAKQLQQVLVNLFTNAMQAMEPRGGGALIIRTQLGPGVVTLEVQDQGPGIPADLLPRVFDPFFSTKSEGTGLGLSVSYAIVRAHGGDLTLHSTVNVGTTFTLTLPVAAADDASAARSVLLVDDEDAVAETLSTMLKREGLMVRRAATGAEALAILATDAFDAVFLDVRLPDISGQEIYAQLAAKRPQQARRVVFVTGGLWRIESRGLREQLPPQPTLGKPCTAAQIREVLRLLRDNQEAA